MIQYNECRLTNSIVDQWISTNVNVLLIGEKGVGKTSQILDGFARNNIKYSYFSGATLDPWIHLLGIPKAVYDENSKKEKMQFVLPENLDENVEAIFCDEWNRTNSIVRNALLELQQFKSINGRKFPNLRMVWGSINPPKNKELDNDEPEYDVEELDPAQQDRFHIIVQLPNIPDRTYFYNKFGKYKGQILCDWWAKQPNEAHKILSPRRLDYIGEFYEKGLDIRYMLPISANADELIKNLSTDEEHMRVMKVLEKPNDFSMKELLSNHSVSLKYMDHLRKEKYWKYWKYANREFIANEIKLNENFQNFALLESLRGETIYKEIINEIQNSSSTENVGKILQILESTNYQPKQTDNISDFILEEDIENLLPVVPTKNTGTESIYKWFSQWETNCREYDTTVGKMTTVLRLEALSTLYDNFYDNVRANPFLVINFVMNSLSSLQEMTITRDNTRANKIYKLVGSVYLLAKKMLPETTFENKFLKDLQKNEKKLPKTQFRGIFGNDSNIAPDFIKTLKEIRKHLKTADVENSPPF